MSFSKSKKNRKILILFYEPFRSGISRHIHYLLSALQGKNFEFWLLCSTDDPTIPSFFHEFIADSHITTVPSNRFFSFKGLLATWKIIRRHNIETVHIHNLQSILWGYGGSILGRSRTIVFTPHIDTACAGNIQWLLRRMWRIFNPFTSSLIALSHAQKEWLLHWKIVDEHKISVINNHISEEKLNAMTHNTPASVAALPKTRPGTFFVTQIGRLDRQKNPFFLLQTAHLLHDDFPEIVFLLVGEGPLRQKLEDRIQSLNLHKNVILTGHQNNIGQLIAKSDVIALTSRWEGMPYVLLEALCLKKPIIATDIPGNRDLIIDGKNGYLIHSEEELAQRLITLSQTERLKEQMGEIGYETHKNLFKIKNMAEPLTTIYHNAN